MRRKLLFILMFALLLVSCNNSNNKTDSNEFYVEFKTDNLNIYTYDILELPINTNASLSDINLTSSNEEIAKIVDYKIIPVSAGEVVVSASLGDKVLDTVKVVVSEDGNVPFLEVSNKEIKLFNLDTYQLNNYVTLRGNEVEATYTYSSSDSDIVSVDEKGLITAKKIGDASINIIADYNGYSGNEYDSLKRTINVSVCPTVILSIGVGSSNINSRSEVYNDVVYSNQTNLNGSILIDNEYRDILDYSCEWVSTDEEVAKVEDGKVVGYKQGKTDVYAKATIDGVVYESNVVSINVEKPTIVVDNEPVDIDLYVNEINLDTSYMVNGDSNILSICDKENNDLNIYDNHKLINYDELGIRKWIIESTSYNYEINVVACSKIITTKEELAALHTYGKNVIKGNSGIVSYEGYFILASDIDMRGTRFRTFCGIGTGATSNIYNGFIGTFDGRGYTVSNSTVAASNGGLFGTVNKASVIKNVAFVNATVSGDSGLISSNFAGMIENVYVEGKLTCTRASSISPSSLLVSKIYDGAKIRNTIVKITNPTINNNYSSAIGMLVSAKEDALENVYVLGTDFKVISTTAPDKYNILVNPNNGQFVEYSDLKSRDLSSFNNYWIFGDTGISFSSSH